MNPAQKRGRSKQDYGTPLAFIEAVERRWGALDVDLSARPDNAKAPLYVPPQSDSLTVPWANSLPWAFCWLNPPFDRLDLWAKKCADEAKLAALMGYRFRLALLTPASVGSRWFADHVHGRALVLALSPRLTFEGCKEPYPKDCMLSLWGFGPPGFDVWRWDGRGGS